MTGPARLAVPEILLMVKAESGHHKGRLVLVDFQPMPWSLSLSKSR